tara:strand:+ start:2067 stop:2540 length:474 start_codon:yes stop_codon:yes gene_type:complete
MMREQYDFSGGDYTAWMKAKGRKHMWCWTKKGQQPVEETEWFETEVEMLNDHREQLDTEDAFINELIADKSQNPTPISVYLHMNILKDHHRFCAEANEKVGTLLIEGDSAELEKAKQYRDWYETMRDMYFKDYVKPLVDAGILTHDEIKKIVEGEPK